MKAESLEEIAESEAGAPSAFSKRSIELPNRDRPT